ncbi:polyamine aminopropyltransferase [Rhodoligotrophos defluvii]|uniref:polyamine aminopropyltransferase n=1 Tax=Rhodoligotrophos defluvii TaxID=2561934 RepID=UPI0010C945D3|nr:polyamine aminopropyltransferase [Rhodoligotrophos defluvii]
MSSNKTARPADQTETWYTETLHADLRSSYRCRKVLFDARIDHQHLVIFDGGRFGKVMMLDGVTQLTTSDEFIYHEMLTHVPILAHGDVREVLVIGGGDGGVAAEALKHRGVQRLTLVEIDAGVVDFSKAHLPEVSRGAFDDPRFELVIQDGRDFVADTDRIYDLIVVDSTDPIGPGEVLFTEGFYRDCRRILRPGGVVVTQNGVPFFQAAELEQTIRFFSALFADATCFLAAVPTYTGGFMALGWGSDDPGLRKVEPAVIARRFADAGIETRYYTPELHHAAFALPKFIGDIVARGRRR